LFFFVLLYKKILIFPDKRIIFFISILNIMIVYLEIPVEKFVELKKKYPIRRNENNGRIYFDTQTPYFGMFMNTGMPFQLQEYVVGKACWDDVMSFGKLNV